MVLPKEARSSDFTDGSAAIKLGKQRYIRYVVHSHAFQFDWQTILGCLHCFCRGEKMVQLQVMTQRAQDEGLSALINTPEMLARGKLKGLSKSKRRGNRE